LGDVLESLGVFHFQDVGNIDIYIGTVRKVNDGDLAVNGEELVSDREFHLLLLVSVESGNVEVGLSKDNVMFSRGKSHHSQVKSLVLDLILINIELGEHSQLGVDIDRERDSFVARNFL
jgi:hypothetical protein